MITADDFGMCPPVNEAIMNCKVDRVGLIIVSPYSEEAIQYCLKHPEIEVDAHIVLDDEFNIGFDLKTIKEQLELFKIRGIKYSRITSHMFRFKDDRKDCTWESYQIRPEAKKDYYDFVIKNFPDKEIIIHPATEEMKNYSPWWESYIKDYEYFKNY